MFVVDPLEAVNFASDRLALLDDRQRPFGSKIDGDAPWNDAVHQQAVAEQPGIEPQPVFPEARKLRQAEGQRDVVAEVAQVTHMVCDALAFEQQCAQP